MLRKTIFIVTILLSLFGFSQKYSFTYVYTFKPDSLNLDKTETELMGLFIDKNGSTYLSLTKVKRDSAIAQNMNSDGISSNMSVSLNTFPQGKVRGIIQKDWRSRTAISYLTLNTDRFKITQHITFNWQIGTETAMIQGKKCQLATVEYKGRKYNAWFTNEIPISDGPYKFGGLPGLIVKIEDTKKQHIWELKAIEKFRHIKLNLTAYIPVTESQYKKAVEDYIRDPIYRMRELKQRYGITSFTSTLPDGRSYSDAEYEKMRIKKIQETFKENNNSIELN
ncbi:GLPGLI family protein [Chryseobacterium cheonjiense]|uniref:GLPGLI family protein n=1 Tax=Chryseobacterium cheonjiense TaxID=2728845 RepID=A0A7Y0AA37_9FLAO|nr:GLPGLI family protein [Chryseobacterium cheonjiense]NML59478.1 GLPGLI family protein [Chryseobacterium cheonjiense]